MRGHGYRILTAGTPHEAIALAGRYPEPIHLLLTDVVMPEMSGRALAEALTATRREMKFAYMTGYTEDAIVHHGVLDSGTVLLPKPFTPAALAGVVREALDEPDRLREAAGQEG